MRTMSPLVLVASAVGVGLFTLLQPEHDVSEPPAAGRPLADREAQPIVPAVSPELRRTFAPQAQFAAPSAEADGHAAANGKGDGGVPLAVSSGAASPPVPAKRGAPSTWTTVVTANPGAAARARPSPHADAGTARYELARDLQRELKRAGCYYSEIDGDWGPGSKRAMTEFADRVNAALPIEEPDVVLLALLQAHAGQVCGRACPAGQGLDANGRCLPHAILARAERKPADRQKRVETIERERKAALERLARAAERGTGAGQPAQGGVPTPPAPLPGRMSVGAPEAGAGAGAPVTGSGLGGIAPSEETSDGVPSDPGGGLGAMTAREASVIGPDAMAAPKRPKRARAAQKPPRYAERAPARQQRTLIYNLFQRIDRVN
jgi:hypothetical protein